MREQLFAYVKKKYKAAPEHLWSRYPDYAIFRHADNKKWFGLVMNIRRKNLGLDGEDVVDILNVKLPDPRLVDLLVQEPGYFRGYHISRGNWVSILLDGTVPFEDVCRWLAESYVTTASRETKQLEAGRRHQAGRHGVPLCRGAGLRDLVSVPGDENGHSVSISGRPGADPGADEDQASKTLSAGSVLLRCAPHQIRRRRSPRAARHPGQPERRASERLRQVYRDRHVGEGLAPPGVPPKNQITNVRRIRAFCEFTSHFYVFALP